MSAVAQGNVSSATWRAALRYAEVGWPVFPIFNPVFRGMNVSCSCGEKSCDRIGKHPNYRLCEHGLLSATCDMDAINLWWSKEPGTSVAIRMGRKSETPGSYEGCGYILLDIDQGYDAKGNLRQGDYELEILQDAIGQLPDTWETRSGTGRHLWFKHPGGDIVLTNKGNIRFPKPDSFKEEVAFLDKSRRNIVLPSLQIRGDGGYVVAPPSRHYRGSSYTWSVGPRDLQEAADIPEALMKIIGRKMHVAPTDDFIPDGSWPDRATRLKRARAWLGKVEGAVAGRGGHDATFRVALWLVRGFVLSVSEAYELMLDIFNPRCVPEWTAEDIARKCEEASCKSNQEWGFAYSRDEERALEREIQRLTSQGLPTWVENDAQAERVQASAALRLVEEDGPVDPPGPPSPPTGGGGQSEGNDGGGGLMHTFITGSEAELASALRQHLEQDGRILTYSESFFWLYDPRRGIWTKLNDDWVEGQFARYDQCPLGQDKLLKISSSMSKGAARILSKSYAAQGGDMNLQSGVEAFHFSHAQRGIAFRNGFLRISVKEDLADLDLELIPHSPRNLARARIDMDWTDSASPSPLLDEFLDNLFHDVSDSEEKSKRIGLVQEFLGAALAGICTSLQSYLLLKGDGNNGKSALIELVEAMFEGSTVSSVPPDAFDKNFSLRSMVGSRINISDDIASGKLSAKAGAQLRRMVTGNRLELDVKYKDPTHFIPVAAHIYSANDLFEPPDSTEGQWRRCLVLPMTADFSKRPDLRKPNAAKIVIRSEMSQVIQWAIRGLIRLIREQRGAFTMPLGAEQAKDEWRSATDPVFDFFCSADEKMRGELNSKGGMSVKDAHTLYMASLEGEPQAVKNKHELSLKAFSIKMRATHLVFQKRKGAGMFVQAEQRLVDIWAKKDMVSQMEIEEASKTEHEPLTSKVPPRKASKP